MASELFFRGRKVTERERQLLADIFGEKIDDLYLCQSILLAAMKPENLLARAAFTRALTKKRCEYTEGGREAKKLIRRVRRKLGYSLSFGDRRASLRRDLDTLAKNYRRHDEAIWRILLEGIVLYLRFFFLFR